MVPRGTLGPYNEGFFIQLNLVTLISARGIVTEIIAPRIIKVAKKQPKFETLSDVFEEEEEEEEEEEAENALAFVLQKLQFIQFA